ncbi:MAG: hypothetical protein ACREX8_13795, partial [Gammaproteobacteria bacterium]
LKQAHESADDITARSRSQAEDRVEVAREEAAAITHEAKLAATELKRETQDLQVERANLIEELRRFAAETLAIANAAADRLDPVPPQEVAEAPVEESLDPPYDGVDDLDPADEWPAEEDPDPPTHELRIPVEERREDEPPQRSG